MDSVFDTKSTTIDATNVASVACAGFNQLVRGEGSIVVGRLCGAFGNWHTIAVIVCCGYIGVSIVSFATFLWCVVSVLGSNDPSVQLEATWMPAVVWVVLFKATMLSWWMIFVGTNAAIARDVKSSGIVMRVAVFSIFVATTAVDVVLAQYNHLVWVFFLRVAVIALRAIQLGKLVLWLGFRYTQRLMTVTFICVTVCDTIFQPFVALGWLAVMSFAGSCEQRFRRVSTEFHRSRIVELDKVAPSNISMICTRMGLPCVESAEIATALSTGRVKDNRAVRSMALVGDKVMALIVVLDSSRNLESVEQTSVRLSMLTNARFKKYFWEVVGDVYPALEGRSDDFFGTCFEAIIGCIYVTHGMDIVQSFVLTELS